MALPKNLSKLKYAEPEEDKYHLANILKKFFCPYQQTPLHIATREGYKLTVESLVDNGADINIQDKAGVSMKTLLRVITAYWYLSLTYPLSQHPRRGTLFIVYSA